jgi:hypothetical protein
MNLVVSGGQVLVVIFSFWFLKHGPLPRAPSASEELAQRAA